MKTECPICASNEITVFFRSPSIPVFCNVLCSTPDEARNIARGDMELACCPRCDAVFNAAFDESRMAYSIAYENALHFSPHFQSHAAALASRLVNTYGLHNKTILEIGCGDGQFLSLLCEKGNNNGIGCDPSHDPDRSAATVHENARITSEPFQSAVADRDIDLICCRHVLEHIAGPRHFLREVRQAIARPSETTVYFEVPSGLHVLQRFGIWDIIYEHVMYFTPVALRNLLHLSGFRTLRIAETYGDQFIELDATVASQGVPSSPSPGPVRDIADAFQHSYETRRSLWDERLTAYRAGSRKVVLWGAGSKGVMFLNLLDVQMQHVAAVIDVNARKHGRFIAGTGHPIAGPRELTHLQPDVVIIMNPVYQREIESQLAELGLRSTQVVVV